MKTISLPGDDYALYRVEAKPVQFHALVLAAFASVVAPFGGFFASAIKRAYNIKDFDSLVPGHGGLMDRMDCQFLMLLCTWIHYSTFVAGNLSEAQIEAKLLSTFMLLSPDRQEHIFQRLMQTLGSNLTCRAP